MRVYLNKEKTEYLSVTVHQGKMTLIPSISTNKKRNANCKAMVESGNSNCICTACYVDDVMNCYKQLEPALNNNTDILTTRLLTASEIEEFSKYFLNTSIVRFESFGDLNNEIQLINYVNIARACKHTKFAMFTKHYSVVREYFKKGNKFPNNITLVLSSPFMDTRLNEMLVDTFKKYHSRTITFTVTRDKTNPSINCGGRRCVECRNCYDAPHPHDVIELLKN